MAWHGIGGAIKGHMYYNDWHPSFLRVYLIVSLPKVTLESRLNYYK